VWVLTPGIQIALVAALFTATTIYGYFDYQHTGQLYGYPLSITILFVPIYEELIFRGLVLGGLLKYYSPSRAIGISSALFGLWHLKNIFYLGPEHLAFQMLYAALFLGPLLGYITWRTKTVWPAVILHYLNNLLAPLTALVISSLF
jgi:membrane protease YdiL (CAAX protease family)